MLLAELQGPSDVPVGFCPSDVKSALVFFFFGGFTAAPRHNSEIAAPLVTAELNSSRISFILHFA